MVIFQKPLSFLFFILFIFSFQTIHSTILTHSKDGHYFYETLFKWHTKFFVDEGQLLYKIHVTLKVQTYVPYKRTRLSYFPCSLILYYLLFELSTHTFFLLSFFSCLHMLVQPTPNNQRTLISNVHTNITLEKI